MRQVVHLTDAQLAQLVDLDAQGVGLPEIARAIAGPYFTVRQAAIRVRAHGWATPLDWRTCPQCGQPYPVPVGRDQQICRRDACRRARIRAYGRSRRLAHPGDSTPYVRAWREENPLKLLAARIHETDRHRGEPTHLTPEQKRTHSVVARRGQKRRNEQTRAVAENHQQIWDGDEERYVVDHPELTNAALAYELGRTAQAVHGRRTLLRKRGLLE